MCLPAKVVAISSTPTTALTDTISMCVASLNTWRVLPLLHVGQGPPLRRSSSFRMCGGRRRRRGPLQEEGRYPLPSQKELYWLCWFLIKKNCVMSIFLYFFCYFFCAVNQDFLSKSINNVAINNHIILLLYKGIIYIWDFSLKEDDKCLPSHQHFDNPALRKDIRVLPTIT